MWFYPVILRAHWSKRPHFAGEFPHHTSGRKTHARHIIVASTAKWSLAENGRISDGGFLWFLSLSAKRVLCCQMDTKAAAMCVSVAAGAGWCSCQDRQPARIFSPIAQVYFRGRQPPTYLRERGCRQRRRPGGSRRNCTKCSLSPWWECAGGAFHASTLVASFVAGLHSSITQKGAGARVQFSSPGSRWVEREST
jgi:hypothetical protein